MKRKLLIPVGVAVGFCLLGSVLWLVTRHIEPLVMFGLIAWGPDLCGFA